MPFEPGLIAYAGLAHLAMARHKFRAASPLPIGIPFPAVRAAGIVLLMLSMVAAMLRFGPAQGAAAWTGQMCIAGVALVLLLSWRPRTALMLSVPILVIGMLMLLVSLIEERGLL